MTLSVPFLVSTASGEKHSAYTTSTVKRTNMWVYYPMSTVYLLVQTGIDFNEYGFAVYAMQSFNSQNYPMKQSILPYLGSLLSDATVVDTVLPAGWAYAETVLDSCTYMNVVSTGEARMVLDGVGNSYSYVDPIFCRYIYEKGF